MCDSQNCPHTVDTRTRAYLYSYLLCILLKVIYVYCTASHRSCIQKIHFQPTTAEELKSIYVLFIFFICVKCFHTQKYIVRKVVFCVLLEGIFGTLDVYEKLLQMYVKFHLDNSIAEVYTTGHDHLPDTVSDIQS